jgi:hypothetical protein
MYCVLYQSPNQRWSHFAQGVYLCAVFSSKQSMQTHYYRVEYGYCGEKEKAACNCSLVVVLCKLFLRNLQKTESMCKRLESRYLPQQRLNDTSKTVCIATVSITTGRTSYILAIGIVGVC